MSLTFWQAGTQEYTDLLKQVVHVSEKNNFYHESLKSLLILSALLPNPNFSLAMDTKGWVILCETEDFVEIRFVFVQSEHRRTGWFTNLLKLLLLRDKRITVCTRESVMVRTLIARGFSMDGKSSDGKELCYKLEENGILKVFCN